MSIIMVETYVVHAEKSMEFTTLLHELLNSRKLTHSFSKV